MAELSLIVKFLDGAAGPGGSCDQVGDLINVDEKGK